MTKEKLELELREFAEMKTLTPQEQENLLTWMKRTENDARSHEKGKYTKQIAKLQKLVNKNFTKEHQASMREDHDLLDDGDILGTMGEQFIESTENKVIGFLKRRGIDSFFHNGVLNFMYSEDAENAKKAFEEATEKKRLSFKKPKMKVFENKTHETLYAVHDGKDWVSSPYSSKNAAEEQRQRLGSKKNHKVKIYGHNKIYEGTQIRVPRHQIQLHELSSGLMHRYAGAAERSFRANPVKKRAIGIKRAISGLRRPVSQASEEVVFESLLSQDIYRRINSYKRMGFRVDNIKIDPNGNSGEFTVTDKSGDSRRHVFHGTKRRVENLGKARPSDEEGDDGGEEVKKKRGRPKKDKFA